MNVEALEQNLAGDSPEQHLDRILSQIAHDLPNKYMAGQSEHGGCLSQKPVAGELKAEALDMIVYVYTALEQLAKVRALISKARVIRDWGLVDRADAILSTGNDRGHR